MQYFAKTGVHALVDGQFGSTGKGALAAFLAHQAIEENAKFGGVISNAGPNSGHTFYHNGEKHVLKQLPTFAVALYLLGKTVPVYLTAGAIIDPDILIAEAMKYPNIPIYVHSCAAVITPQDKEAEHSGTVQAVAGTRSGTGAVLARKVLRDPTVIFADSEALQWVPKNVRLYDNEGWNWTEERYFLEVSQGFSLGLNEARFYPKTTSRECTVMQGLADARLPPQSVEMTYLSVRTYPIRVGNFEGFSSGGHYPDQRETTWEEIGQTPELTTVTQRIRRVFTFSAIQFMEAVEANCPTHVFLNFLNYLTDDKQRGILESMERMSRNASQPFDLLLGFGPEPKDVKPAK